MSPSDIELDISVPVEEPKASTTEEARTSAPTPQEEDAPILQEAAPETRKSSPRQETTKRATGESGREQLEQLLQRMMDWGEEEDDGFGGRGWKEFFRGMGLVSLLRHNWKFILLLIGFFVLSVALGYQTRDALVENDRLNRELLDRRYKALTRSSELRERTLRSKIEQQLADTTLRTSTRRPYKLPVEEE